MLEYVQISYKNNLIYCTFSNFYEYIINVNNMYVKMKQKT